MSRERVFLTLGIERTPEGRWWIFAGPRDRVKYAPQLLDGTGAEVYAAACALLKQHFVEVFAPPTE